MNLESLMLIERIVLESVSKKDKNIYELSLDTNLEQGLLLNILPELLMKNLIKYNRGIYSINKEQSLRWSETINSKDSIKEEVKELFTNLVNEYFNKEQNKKSKDTDLKVQKVWLSFDEEKLLNMHLVNLENFFKNIKLGRERNPIKEKTHEQKVVIWGVSNYSDLVLGALEAV